MNEFVRVVWPAAVLVAALPLGFVIRRYLFARKCWRCGAFLEPEMHGQHLFGLVPL